MPHLQSVGRPGYLLLVLYSLLFFGYSTIGGRPLTMHEGRLPETSREMFASSDWRDWLVPRSGGRPWVERPPVPHWLTIAVTAPLGGPDAVWKVRLAPALAGLLCVLLVAWMGARLFGRSVGLLAGFVQASTYELFNYAWLAEDDIFLCTVIFSALAIFVHLEFSPRYAVRETIEMGELSHDQVLQSRHESLNPLGWRPWPVLALFALLGAGSLVKGLVFGTVMAGIPMAGYLLWNHDWRRILRYIWVWGVLVALVVAAWWPLLAEHLAPGSAEIWAFDLFGRLNKQYLGQPPYYYLVNLPGIIAPWTPFCLLGLVLTALPACRERYSPLRFVWCWGVLTILVFSLPDSKHHHYLLHVTGAWAIFAAFGLRWVWGKLPHWPRLFSRPAFWLVVGVLMIAGLWCFQKKLHAETMWLVALSVFLLSAFFLLACGLRGRRPDWALGAVLAGVSGLAMFMYSGLAAYQDQTTEDTAFLQAVKRKVPEDAPLVINAHPRGSMDFFRIQFYLPARAELIHNETYLQQERFRGRTLYLIDRSSSAEWLGYYGRFEVLAQSVRSRREEEHAGKLTLYQLTVRVDLPTYQPLPITPMQAMSRFDVKNPAGPYLGGRERPLR